MTTHDDTTSTSPTVQPVTDWTDLGQEMWSYLTGKGAAVSYELIDMAVEVPRDTGPEAPRATWKLNGTLRITTSDDDRPTGSSPQTSSARSMTAVLHLAADLTFEIEVPPDGPRPQATVRGTVRAAGNEVTIHSDDLMSLAAQPSRAVVRRVADELAGLGLAVSVSGPEGVVVTLGAVRVGRLQRLVTRSRHIRVTSWRRALTAVRARRRPASRTVNLVSTGLPPSTPWPPIPTVAGLPRIVTTTHDPAGGGHPRLYLSDASDPSAPRVVGVVEIPSSGLTIGSGDDVGLRLAGTDVLQAEIERTDDDEYVLVARSSTILSTVAGRQLPRQTLRTGSRVQLGPWRLSYVRDEFADHGRPYGGRIGGELGRQRTQPRPVNRTGPGF